MKKLFFFSLGLPRIFYLKNVKQNALAKQPVLLIVACSRLTLEQKASLISDGSPAILRSDWGFKYIVVSNCRAISDFWQGHKVSSDAVLPCNKRVRGCFIS